MKDILTYCFVCRYNTYWEKYKKRVPYKILPHVYWHLLDQIDGSLFYLSLQMGSGKWLMINERKLKRGWSNFWMSSSRSLWSSLLHSLPMLCFESSWLSWRILSLLEPSHFLLISQLWGIVTVSVVQFCSCRLLSFKPRGFLDMKQDLVLGSKIQFK